VEVSARLSATSPGRPPCVGGVYGRSSPVSLCSLRGSVSWCPGLGRLLGQRSFAVCCSRTWNRLPTALRSPELSLGSFKRQLKTHLSVPHTHRISVPGPSCSSTRQCWLQLWVSCRVPSSHRRCCDCTASSAPTTNVQTRLDSISRL